MSFRVSLDSARIAESTANDGFAMMTIAIMTLLFLPATFFATLFAMPILGMSSESTGGMMVPQMYLYVELAVSVTVAAIVLWLIVICYHESARKSRDAKREQERRKLGWQGRAWGGRSSPVTKTGRAPFASGRSLKLFHLTSRKTGKLLGGNDQKAGSKSEKGESNISPV